MQQHAIEFPMELLPSRRGGAVAFVRPAVRALRPHQWVKNALVPVPLLLAHRLPWDHPDPLGDPLWQWARAVAAVAAFCLAASAIYLVNDLRDLEADRAHPTKRRRPFASGALPTAFGLPMVASLMAAMAGICALLPPRFALVLGLYVSLSLAYALWLKRKLLVDVFVLAGLYTLRLLAGGEAAGVGISRWLLAFSIFFFVSLAFAKRYSELQLMAAEGRTKASGRNYTLDDLRVIEGAGPASGYLAVLVLALYINDASGAAGRLYAEPFFLWLLCPLLMYWVSRVWFLAGRQMLDDDPILFAVRDKVSWW
ncbi:MAG: Decaprenyl-phosphate phosphoribosyltransferase, partial [Phycisphaerales bacterium]|nr:Decaprenyl-phosphate phosphoribosyltransferase [Phycisphaerales bacterium]